MDLLPRPGPRSGQGLVDNGHARELVAGTSLGHYQVLSLLATDGMGQLYLAEDLRVATPSPA